MKVVKETNREFKNRVEAGQLLGKELNHYHFKNPVVLGIARGGVVTGIEVAKILKCEFAVVVARKLGYPEQPEAAFGALAEDGSLYMNPWVRIKLTDEDIKKVIQREEKEIQRRVMVYRDGRSLPDLHGRSVIIVDDGIATGSTLFVTIDLCKKRQAGQIVVAAPVCGNEMMQHLKSNTDHTIVLKVPEDYYAVSQVYQEFLPVSDSDVKLIVSEWASFYHSFNSESQIVN